MKTFQVGGKEVIVDDDKYEWCIKQVWRFNPDNPYIFKTGQYGAPIHSYIIGDAPLGFVTDHIDRNKMNNQKSNLRFVTKSQNAINSKVQERRLKNIYRTKEQKFYVRIMRKGEIYRSTNFTTLTEAVTLRDHLLSQKEFA